MSDKRLNKLCSLSIERSLSQELLECPKDCVGYFATLKKPQSTITKMITQ